MKCRRQSPFSLAQPRANVATLLPDLGWQEGVALCGLLNSSLYQVGALYKQMAKFSPVKGGGDFLQQITEGS